MKFFLSGVEGISPPCHGFIEEERGQELSIQIGDQIKGLESNDVLDGNGDQVPGTPKRMRTGDTKPQRKVKRRSDPNDDAIL